MWERCKGDVARWLACGERGEAADGARPVPPRLGLWARPHLQAKRRPSTNGHRANQRTSQCRQTCIGRMNPRRPSVWASVCLARSTRMARAIGMVRQDIRLDLPSAPGLEGTSDQDTADVRTGA